MNYNLKLGLRGKTTLALTGMLFLVLGITSISSYRQSKAVTRQKVIELEHREFQVLKHEIEGSLLNHKKNLISLRDVPPVQAIFRAIPNNNLDPETGDTTEIWRNRLIQIFKAFAKNHEEYLQIRLIDATGNEQVKVQRNLDKSVVSIEGNALQNKFNSSYVIETIKLQDNEVYYSNVTLNREHGVVQVPHQAVFRIATPIYSADERVVALIIINLSTDELFSNVYSEIDGEQRHIVDERGNYLKHEDPGKILGIDQGIEYRFQDKEKELNKILLTQDQLLRYHEKHKELEGFQKIYFSSVDHSRFWLMTLKIPEHLVFAEVYTLLNKMLLTDFIIGIVSILLILQFITKNVLNPVTTLAKATDHLQKGDLTTRLKTSFVKDEFYTLYTAVNQFAQNQQHATKQLKNQVVAQTKRLSAIINNIVDAIITINDDGIIESFNPAAMKIFGYKETQVIGQNVKMLMPEPNHSKHDGYLERNRKIGHSDVIDMKREVRGQRRDGTTFPMDLAVSSLEIEGITRFVGIIRDITEKKRMENMQKEFISTVSHELRTPLTSIRGSLGLILGGVTGEIPEKAKGMLTIANNNSERLILLINDILDIEKMAAGKINFDFKVVNVISVIQQAVESNRGYGESLDVRFKYIPGPDDMVMVRIDEKRIAQVMSNLLSNAAKYSPGGDQVDVWVESKKDSVRILVRDHGKGIPEEFKSKIFSKFSQADSSDTRKKGGTGLGLNITKAIVENHEGSIGFDCDTDMGTTFYFDLPLWQMKDQVKEIKKECGVENPLILIVEGDKDVSKFISILLEKEGYQTHQAYNYQDAVQMLKKNNYNAITLDLTIPGGCGLSFMHKLREDESTKELPVIVVSSKSMEGQHELNCDAFRMVDWIEKPINEDKLFEAIRSRLTLTTDTGGCILHVEDDPDVATIVDSLLGNERRVVHAKNLNQAKQLLEKMSFDLVLLDLGLPDGSGLDLLPILNQPEYQIPVVIFSANDVSSDIAAQVKGSLVKSKVDNENLTQLIKTVLDNNKKTL